MLERELLSFLKAEDFKLNDTQSLNIPSAAFFEAEPRTDDLLNCGGLILFFLSPFFALWAARKSFLCLGLVCDAAVFSRSWFIILYIYIRNIPWEWETAKSRPLRIYECETGHRLRLSGKLI